MARPVWCSEQPGRATYLRVKSSPFSRRELSQISCCSRMERQPLTGTISPAALRRETRPVSMAAARASSRTSLPGRAGARTGRSAPRIGCSAFTRTSSPLCIPPRMVQTSRPKDTSSSSRAGNSNPMPRIMLGKRLWDVKPGIVLTSLNTRRPVGSRNMSTRAKPRQPRAR